ncbi:DUF4383 domain-containing protein [Kitasatospora cineracea]|uniref:DUF4383 domain-containing protein n=1 Tax=Kitasatospora cineracea TaxID=88074 RepID=UPI00379E8997
MHPHDEPVADRRLSRIHRFGAGLCALLLLAFGALGLADGLPFFGTHGEHVAGLSGNGLLSVVSIGTAAVLLTAALLGGRAASTVTIVVGTLFVLSGFVNLALLETSANLLAFRLPNVLFSFATGLLIATFGMYGRISGGLPHDNPYWRRRHPEAVATATATAIAVPAVPAVGPAVRRAALPGDRG